LISLNIEFVQEFFNKTLILGMGNLNS